MNLSRRQLLALLGGMVLANGCASSEKSESTDRLRDELERELARTKGVGMACAIVSPGRVRWSGGFGVANIEHQQPMLADTLINVASVSKTVTATAVMQLWEQNRFAFKDDVGRYLPFALRNPHFPDVPITFEQLLTHRSSIRDNGPIYERTYVCGDSPMELGEWLKEYFTPGGAYWGEDNWHRWAPGTMIPPPIPRTYSNVGFGVLGYLVELLAGKPFPAFCRDRIFHPLGMRHTGWLLRDIDLKRHATPYTGLEVAKSFQSLVQGGIDLSSLPPGTPVPLCLYSFANYPDGSLRTSVNELARFLAAYLGRDAAYGSRLLKPDTIALMFSGKHFGQHLCWAVQDLPDGRSVIMHGGKDPGVTCFIAFEPSTRVGALCVRNYDAHAADNARVMTLLLDAGRKMNV